MKNITYYVINMLLPQETFSRKMRVDSRRQGGGSPRFGLSVAR
jgi:hypothetical protein